MRPGYRSPDTEAPKAAHGRVGSLCEQGAARMSLIIHERTKRTMFGLSCGPAGGGWLAVAAGTDAVRPSGQVVLRLLRGDHGRRRRSPRSARPVALVCFTIVMVALIQVAQHFRRCVA